MDSEYAKYIPIIVSVGAVIISLIGIYIQNRNFQKQIKSAHTVKLADMRQAWINSLRDEMSKFQSYGITPNLEQIKERAFYEHGTKIELFMNPEDKNFKELNECQYNFLLAKTQSEKYSANQKYINVCQRILKNEWEFLKKDLKSNS